MGFRAAAAAFEMRVIGLLAVLAALLGRSLAQTPEIRENGVVNGASFQPAGHVAPGSLVSIFGTNLASGPAQSSSIPLPTSLANVSVTFNNVAAPLRFVSGGQINAQAPWNMSAGTVAVVVARDGISSRPVLVQVDQFSPGILTIPSGNQLLAVAVNEDGTLAQPQGAISGVAARPARPGDVLSIYATGLGAVDPPAGNGRDSTDTLRRTVATPTVLIGSQEAQVLFAGLSPQFVGVNQINVLVPTGSLAGDAVPLQIRMGAMTASGNVTIAVAAGAARQFPNTTNAIFVFSDQIETGNLTEAQFRFAATHYVGSQKLQVEAARHLRRYNSNYLVLHYRLGQGLGHSIPSASCQPTSNSIQIINGTWVNEWPGDGNVQENWFFHWNGQRVFDCDFGWYLTELNDPGWRRWWSDQIIAQLIANQDDGVFADSFSVPNYGFTWSPALPVVDAAFESAWAQREHDFTDYIRSRFAGRWRWIPNIGSFITTRDPSDYSNVDGVMIEQFAEAGNGSFFATIDWQLQMDRVLQLAAADKIILAQSYPDGNTIDERLFDLGSYLLIKGAHTYINLLSFGQNLYWLPEYMINLGPPADPLPTEISKYFNPNWNVYVRSYANGMVLVNPSDTPTSTFDLGRVYDRLIPSGSGLIAPDGTAPGSLLHNPTRTLSICAHCAVILLSASK